MRKLSFLVLVALACLLFSQASLFAETTQSDWPKYQRDAYNSGRTPATAIAKPDPTWVSPVMPNIVSYATPGGPVFDKTGDIYFVEQKGGVYKVQGSTGNVLWGPSFNMDGNFWGNITLLSIGNTTVGLAGPGWTDKYCNIFDLSNGNAYQQVDTTDYTDGAPTPGINGRVYIHLNNNGEIACIEPVDMTNPTGAWRLVWLYTAPADVSLWQDIMTMGFVMTADKDDPTVKPHLLVSGAGWGETTVTCIRDDGASASLVWSQRAGFQYGTVSVSNDGKTVYVPVMERYNVLSTDDPLYEPENLFAYDIPTGNLKWKLDCNMSMWQAPAIGADGTIYCPGGYHWSLEHPYGRLLAIKDNGTSATIKWDYTFQNNERGFPSNAVVTSSNPPIIYVGTGYQANNSPGSGIPAGCKARIYAIRDNGDSPELLWTYGGGYGTNPDEYFGVSGLAAKNDGTLVATWGKRVASFPPGWTNQGIQGIVKDAAGKPVKGAYVSAKATADGAYALADNPKEDRYCITDSRGFYRIVVPAGSYKVAAWADGKIASDEVAVTTTANTEVKNANFTLNEAGLNRALFATATASSGTASAATDGDIQTMCTSSDDANTNPAWLSLDLGANQTVNSITIKWDNSYAADYKVQCLPDGANPADEASWSAPAAQVYSVTGANGGIRTWRLDEKVPWWSVGTDVIKLTSAKSARYWRVYATKTGDQGFNTTPDNHIAIREFELNDPNSKLVSGISGIKDAQDGWVVMISAARITAVPGGGIPENTLYVESANRSAGVRVAFSDIASKQIGIGDAVKIMGVVKTSTAGEKYIEATNLTSLSDHTAASPNTPRPLDAVVMNSRTATDKTSQGMFVKLVGKVEAATGAESFTLNDGGKPVKVYCGTITAPAKDNSVKVRGVLSTDGTNAALLVRDALDIADSAAKSQPLPFPGAMKYIRDCIIAGPFTDANAGGADNQTKADNLMAIDFIARANPGGSVAEYNVQPAAGEAVGPGAPGMTWKRYNGASDKINFNAFYNNGTENEFSVSYAVVYVYSPVDQNNVDLTLGSDDQLKVWFNGNSSHVYFDQTMHGTNYSQFSNTNSGMGVNLNQGVNTFVFKVVNGTSAYGLCANIIEPLTWGTGVGWGDGYPKPGVGYYPDRP